MKNSPLKIVQYYFLLLCTLCAMGTGTSASAQNMGNAHPAYLHALSSLRAARWMVEHKQGSMAKSMDEDAAVQQINAAIGELKKAAIDDGKNLNDHPPVDDHSDHGAKLHAAVKFLKEARDDISRDEDNGFANGLRDRAYMHIDAAIGSVKHAIHE